MSKIFYDHLIMIDEIFTEVDALGLTEGESTDLRRLIDELTHTRAMTHILDLLPTDHHQAFLDRFHASPFDLSLVLFLQDKTGKDMHKELSAFGKKLREELKGEIHKHKKRKK